MTETRKRVIFSFDDRSLESLKKMVKQGRHPDATCPHCLMRRQNEQEFKAVVVRNPETGEERIIVIPKTGI
jgi:hypothetical protein